MMLKRVLVGLAIGASAFAGTWDVAANFNASNNPSARNVFSYGWGASPGLFVPMVNVVQNCFAASPTECLDNNQGFPLTSAMAWNGTPAELASGTVHVVPGFVNVDPQSSGGTILRFTAPWTDIYVMAGNYRGDDAGQAPTVGWVYHNNTALESVNVNTYTALSPIGFSNLALNAGDTIDFIVTAGGCCYDSTGLGAVITSRTDGPSSVPEPGTLLLIPAGLVVAMRRARRS
jgi:hypothetical protein